MRALKRTLTLVAVCFALVCLFVPMKAEAAAPKLNKKKLTIAIGEKKTLSVKNYKKTVKWSSSVKSVATVNKKGLITGKKAGKTVITAKAGKKKLKCNVTVKSILSTNKTVVKLKMGQKATVKIGFSKIRTHQVTWNVGDKSIVQPKWASKWSSKDINLYLTAGNKVGTTTVTVTNKFNKEKVKITVIVEPNMQIKVKNKMGSTFAEYGYDGEVEKLFTITNVTQDVTYYSYSNEYTAEIYVSGKKIFDEDGASKNSSVEFEWKLYKNGRVIESGNRYTASIRTGEFFADEKFYIFDLTDGVYELEFIYEIKVDGYERLKNYIKKYGKPNSSGHLAISTELGTSTDYQYVEIAYNATSNELEFFYYRDEDTYDSVTSVFMVWNGNFSSSAYVGVDQEMQVLNYNTVVKGTSWFTVPNFTKDSSMKFQAEYTEFFEQDTVYNTLRASVNLGVASWNVLLLETGISMEDIGFASY